MIKTSDTSRQYCSPKNNSVICNIQVSHIEATGSPNDQKVHKKSSLQRVGSPT
jgi:hypothetical protein